jgi:hypothetical protein
MATYDLGTIGYTLENTGGPKTITELKQLAQAGIEAHRSTTQLSQGNRLSQYFASVDKQITAVNRNMQNHNRYLAQAGQQTNRFGVVTQQAGYQIGDFLVQVQSGTNWMVAFGQQATQLVGVLPLMGAGFMGLSAGALVALSAGLGIAIPLVTAIGAAFMRTGEDASNASEGLDAYQKALEGVKSSIQSTQVELDKLTFGTEDPVMAAALKALEQAEQELAIARSSQRRIGNAIVPTSEELANLQQAVLNFTEMARLVRDLEARNAALAEAQQMLNGYLSAAAGTQGRLADEKMRELQAAKDLEVATINAHQAYAATRMEANQTAEQVALIESGMSQAAVDALRFAGVDLSSGISAAAREAAILAGNMGIALSQAISIKNMRESEVYSGRGGDPRDFMQGGSKSYSEGFRPFVADTTRSGGAARIKKETEAVKELTEAEKQRLNILQSIEGSLEDGFMSMVDGTKSVKDAFRSMAAEIIKELYRVLVVQRLVGAISGGIGMFSGRSTGSLGLPFGLATGGSVMPGKSYLVGENGPELVIPRHSGTVVNANQTANAAGGNGTTVVNNNISVTGSDAAMVRAEVAKMIPQITNATKAAVIDARLRGGQMKSAFR